MSRHSWSRRRESWTILGKGMGAREQAFCPSAEEARYVRTDFKSDVLGKVKVICFAGCGRDVSRRGRHITLIPSIPSMILPSHQRPQRSSCRPCIQGPRRPLSQHPGSITSPLLALHPLLTTKLSHYSEAFRLPRFVFWGWVEETG